LRTIAESSAADENGPPLGALTVFAAKLCRAETKLRPRSVCGWWGSLGRLVAATCARAKPSWRMRHRRPLGSDGVGDRARM